MSRAVLALILLLATGLPAAAQQQDRVWIQIAARSSQDAALSLLQSKERALKGLQGMRMRSGWFAVVLGPFAPSTGQAELTRLVAQGRIPQDSFIATRDDFRRQFWPRGRNSLWRNAPLASRQPGSMAIPQPDPPPTQAAAITESPLAPPAGGLAQDTGAVPAPNLDETPAEARASERALDATAHKDLQRALAWFGFYNSAIDGDFGPGTRRAMADWQSAKGFDPTGVLTARQRGLILTAFRDDIAALGLEQVTNDDAGIVIDLPKGVVHYQGTDAPFVRYVGDGADPARVVLISQAGDADRMKALFDVLQTLEIVPPGSKAQLGKTSFTIDGETATATTHIEAGLYGPDIKGFALVWPKSAPGSAARIAEAMASGFQALPDKVLPDNAGNPEDQNVDLMAGLAIRRPEWTRSGIFIDAKGEAVTLADGLSDCGKVTLGDELAATATVLPGKAGLALVTPLSPAAPLATASFRETPGWIGSQVTVGLYPLGGRVAAPSTSFGKLADNRSPGGDATGLRLEMPGKLGDTGGPILDDTGAVLGLIAPRVENGVTPPEGVERGISAPAITAALDAAGVAWTKTDAVSPISHEVAATDAAGMTALVSCWK